MKLISETLWFQYKNQGKEQSQKRKFRHTSCCHCLKPRSLQNIRRWTIYRKTISSICASRKLGVTFWAQKSNTWTHNTGNNGRSQTQNIIAVRSLASRMKRTDRQTSHIASLLILRTWCGNRKEAKLNSPALIFDRQNTSASGPRWWRSCVAREPTITIKTKNAWLEYR